MNKAGSRDERPGERENVEAAAESTRGSRYEIRDDESILGSLWRHFSSR